MTDTNNMVHVAQRELEELVGEDTGGICESEEGVIRKDCPQTHCSAMQNCFMAETAQAPMAVYDFNLLSKDDVAKDWERGEDGGEGRFAVDDEEWNVVDFEAVCEVSNARSAFVCVRDDDDFVASVYELRGELVDVTFDTSWLGEEVVADHGNVVRHFDELRIARAL